MLWVLQMGVQTWEAGLPDSSLSILCKLNHHFTTVSLNFQVCKVGIMTPTSLVCTQPNIVPGTEQVPSPLQAFTFISQWSLKQRTCRAIFEGVGRAGFCGGLSPWPAEGHLLSVPSRGLPCAWVQSENVSLFLFF